MPGRPILAAVAGSRSGTNSTPDPVQLLLGPVSAFVFRHREGEAPVWEICLCMNYVFENPGRNVGCPVLHDLTGKPQRSVVEHHQIDIARQVDLPEAGALPLHQAPTSKAKCSLLRSPARYVHNVICWGTGVLFVP